jgi:HAD superfamily hydrolase (TIGR01549 family)
MRARRGYDAILFDVGGTLLDIVRDPSQMAVDAIAHLGGVSAVAFAAGRRQAVEEWRSAGGPPEAQDLPETGVSLNRRALALVGFEGDIAAAARIMQDTFRRDGWRVWKVYSDVVDVLAGLGASGYRLGVVSNWPATLETTLERVGLRKHFLVIVASAVVGYAKPHPQIFRIAAGRLGSDPQGALFVGDSVEHDVVGANAAGMDVVLLDRAGRPHSHEPRIQSLSELPELLKHRS